MAAWSDITGPAFLARNNAGIAGEYSFLGSDVGGCYDHRARCSGTRKSSLAIRRSGPARYSPAIRFFGRGGGRELPFRRGGRGGAGLADHQLSKRARRHEQHRRRQHDLRRVDGDGHGRVRGVRVLHRAGGVFRHVAERAFPGVDDRRRAGGDDRSRRRLGPAARLHAKQRREYGLGVREWRIGAYCFLRRRAGVCFPGRRLGRVCPPADWVHWQRQFCHRGHRHRHDETGSPGKWLLATERLAIIPAR